MSDGEKCIRCRSWSSPDVSVPIEKRIRRQGGIYVKMFLFFIYLLLPGISAKIFQVFLCQDCDPGDVEDEPQLYMRVDHSVSST